MSEHDSKFVYDELAGFMIAGVDPIATNMGWGLKQVASGAPPIPTLSTPPTGVCMSPTTASKPPAAGT